jgi:uncharacterized pyridoxal phosphate-containing UPF0001 family protein
VLAAAAAGLHDVAESYAQELVATHDAVDAELTWHFLGALQGNKLGKLASRVDVYQSVSGERDARRLARRAGAARCYVEVDVTGEPGRPGCRRDEVPDVLAAARDAGLVVEGLMCVASVDPTLAAGQFDWLRGAAERCGLEGLSMGMTGDFELACARGATMVRLGTGLFGPRPPNPPVPLA